MRNYLLTLYSIIIVTYTSNSQNQTIEWWSGEYKSEGVVPAMVFKLITEDEHAYYFIVQHPVEILSLPKYSLNIYNKINKKITSFELNAIVNNDWLNSRFEDVLLINNQIVLFLSLSKHREYQLYAITIDRDGKHNKPKLIKKIHKNDSRDYCKYNFILSEDGNKCLVINRIIESNKELQDVRDIFNPLLSNENRNKLEYVMLGKDLDTLWSKKIIPDSLECNVFEQHIVLPDGNMVVLTKKISSKSKEIIHKLLNYNYEEDKFYEINISTVKQSNLTGAHLQFINNSIHLGCYHLSELGTIDGVFYSVINPDNFIIKFETFKKFNANIIAKYEKGNDKGLDKKIVLKNIILKSNGSVQLIGEVSIKNQSALLELSSSRDGILINNDLKPNSLKSDPYDETNEILMTQLNNTGEIDWTHMQLKRQNAERAYTSFISYHVINTSDTTYLIYNDNGNNLFHQTSDTDIKKPIIKPYTVNKGSETKCVCVIIKIANDGTFRKETLASDQNDVGCKIVIKEIKALSKNQFWVAGVFKKRPRFGIMTL